MSSKGITTDPKKTETVEEWPTSINLKEMYSVLSLANYYRNFVCQCYHASVQSK